MAAAAIAGWRRRSAPSRAPRPLAARSSRLDLLVAVAAGQRLDELGRVAHQRWLVLRLDDAGLQVAGDGEAHDERAHQRLRLLRHVPERLGALEAECALEPQHVAPLAGMDLAAVAARGAARQPVGFEQHHVGAGLGEMDGGGEPGIAAADDADIGPARAVERRELRTSPASASRIAGRRKGAGHGVRKPRR